MQEKEKRKKRKVTDAATGHRLHQERDGERGERREERRKQTTERRRRRRRKGRRREEEAISVESEAALSRK